MTTRAVSYADEMPGFIRAADGSMRYAYGKPFTPAGPRQDDCSCIDLPAGARILAVKCPLHGLPGRIASGDVERDDRQP